MKTRNELEEQAHFALMDVNRHWLEALAAEEERDLGRSHAAFEDMITAARAGRAALEAVETMVEEHRTKEHAA